MRSPIVDARDKQQLIEQMREMVPFYTPEWRFMPESPDPGTALFLIFADMFRDNIKRLNRVPLKHFISFLNMLGVTLASAKPARGYLTFQLISGAPEAVFVPKGIKVSADTNEEEGGILFETESDLLVTPANLVSMYNVSVKQDRIIRVANQVFLDNQDNEALPVPLFDVQQGENLQEHCLYIGHRDLFNLQESVMIELEFGHSLKRYKEHAITELLADTTYVEWLYRANGEWHPFERVEWSDNKLRLIKTERNKLTLEEMEEVENRWIMCRLSALKADDPSSQYSDIELDSIRAKTDYYDVEQKGGFAPDRMYANTVEVNPEGFYPFGEFFSLYDAFYISSQEAFSKKEAQITLSFKLKTIANKLQEELAEPIDWKLIMKASKFEKADPQPISVVQVLWEYWNGQGWVRLFKGQEYEDMFYFPSEEEQTIVFTCPPDLVETFVNSEENYWIRARVQSMENIYSTNAVYQSPWMADVRLTYEYGHKKLTVENCLTYNNLECRNRSEEVKYSGTYFQPFYALNAKYPALYFGFDQAPLKGPISLFFSLAEQFYTAEERPAIEWEYLGIDGNQKRWLPLKVLDETDQLTKSGLVQFVGSANFVQERIFAQELYWLRAVNRDEKFERTENEQPIPLARGVFLNTIRVVQTESVQNEIPEKISMIAEEYAVAKTPVISIDVWVDEVGLTEAEIDQLEQQGRKLNVIRDSEGNIQQIWVLWQEVGTLLESGTEDRHYVLDSATGVFRFGNGVNGKTPPNPGVERIRVNYKVGGGKKGNLPPNSITSLQHALPFVQTVSNPTPSQGGHDLESLEGALVRGSQMLKNRNRAVTEEDFEWLAREASQEVAKVKCLANRNVHMEKEVGKLTLVILPKGGQEAFLFFSELKERVERYLLPRAAITVAFPENIQVIPAALLEISLSVSLVVQKMEHVYPTEMEALRKLEQFLDPYFGNYDGQGWEIGEHIHPSIFYALLKSINHVRFVENLSLTVYKVEHGQRTELNQNQMHEILHGIIVNGEHQVVVRVGGE